MARGRSVQVAKHKERQRCELSEAHTKVAVENLIPY